MKNLNYLKMNPWRKIYQGHPSQSREPEQTGGNSPISRPSQYLPSRISELLDKWLFCVLYSYLSPKRSIFCGYVDYVPQRTFSVRESADLLFSLLATSKWKAMFGFDGIDYMSLGGLEAWAGFSDRMGHSYGWQNLDGLKFFAIPHIERKNLIPSSLRLTLVMFLTKRI